MAHLVYSKSRKWNHRGKGAIRARHRGDMSKVRQRVSNKINVKPSVTKFVLKNTLPDVAQESLNTFCNPLRYYLCCLGVRIQAIIDKIAATISYMANNSSILFATDKCCE